MDEELPEPSGEFLLYSGPDGPMKVECRFQDETLWLTERLRDAHLAAVLSAASGAASRANFRPVRRSLPVLPVAMLSV